MKLGNSQIHYSKVNMRTRMHDMAARNDDPKDKFNFKKCTHVHTQTEKTQQQQKERANIGGKCWQHTRWLESSKKPTMQYSGKRKGPQKKSDMLGKWKNQCKLLSSLFSNTFPSETIKSSIVQVQARIKWIIFDWNDPVCDKLGACPGCTSPPAPWQLGEAPASPDKQKVMDGRRDESEMRHD